MQPTTTKNNIAFWGTSRFSVIILDELARAGIFPTLIVTAPPRKKGRGLELSSSPVKEWADKNNIQTLEPEEIKSADFLKILGAEWDLFIIASYGKIIPASILDIPKHGTLNVHPSLLPKFRGASPLQSAILENVPSGISHTAGVTIMQIDEQMDHGPIVAQEEVLIPHWPPKESKLEEILGELGGKLLAKIIAPWISGAIVPRAQAHEEATYTKKITKESGEIFLNGDPEENYRKIQAFDTWPRAYFMTKRGGRDMRVVIIEAHLKGGELVLDRVIPEGKREMDYAEFLHGQK